MSHSGSGKAFFAYRLPGEKDVAIGVGKVTGAKEYDTPEEGFLVAPFLPDEGYGIILPEVTISTPVSRPEALPVLDVSDSASPSEEYAGGITWLTSRLEARGGKAVGNKTVLSRIIEGRTRRDISVADIFHTLCINYPDSYVYCWKLPGENIWAGAVPELLLETKGYRLNTMSLAGTQPSCSSDGWDIKNRQEQEIVTYYIRELFTDSGMLPESLGPFEKHAGPVKHLCTCISARRPEGDFDALDFARLLAPTPAVCGMPVKEAMEDIARLERHERKYYGGYSGPVRGRNSCKLYVTLRCMEIAAEETGVPSHTVRIYTGGGITARSQADTEWRETRLKASTLTSLFG